MKLNLDYLNSDAVLLFDGHIWGPAIRDTNDAPIKLRVNSTVVKTFCQLDSFLGKELELASEDEFKRQIQDIVDTLLQKHSKKPVKIKDAREETLETELKKLLGNIDMDEQNKETTFKRDAKTLISNLDDMPLRDEVAHSGDGAYSILAQKVLCDNHFLILKNKYAFVLGQRQETPTRLCISIKDKFYRPLVSTTRLQDLIERYEQSLLNHLGYLVKQFDEFKHIAIERAVSASHQLVKDIGEFTLPEPLPDEWEGPNGAGYKRLPDGNYILWLRMKGRWAWEVDTSKCNVPEKFIVFPENVRVGVCIYKNGESVSYSVPFVIDDNLLGVNNHCFIRPTKQLNHHEICMGFNTWTSPAEAVRIAVAVLQGGELGKGGPGPMHSRPVKKIYEISGDWRAVDPRPSIPCDSAPSIVY